MIGKEVEELVLIAETAASERSHEFVTLEHLLWALLEIENVHRMLVELGADIEQIRDNLTNFFAGSLPIMDAKSPEHTAAFSRVVQRAVLHAQYSSAETLNATDVLAALLTEEESHAVYFVFSQGVSRLDVLEFLSHGLEDEDYEEVLSELEEEEEDNQRPAQKNVLAQYTSDLIKRARDGLIDPLIGREKELKRLGEILARRNKNNPILVGDQGVGKTAIAEGFALKIVQGAVPKRFLDMQIYALDIGALVAGTKYRGDFERRLKGILSELETLPNAALIIDEIHAIIGSGSTTGSSLDMANLLKPALASGKLSFIGSTTYEEYKQTIEKDRALSRRFLKLEVREPSTQETINILQGLKSRYEEHHGVKFSPSSLREAAVLSDKFIRDRFLPDKAIDVIDEAGAKLSLERSEQSEENPACVSVSQIEKVVSAISRVPAKSVTSKEKERIRELDAQLKSVVFGQDEAIDLLSRAIRRAKAGLRALEKPIGSFLLAGPTGVGKTEVAKQVASVLGIELVRFDMSEYMEKHSISRLIGAPPGYVGYDKGGLLTDAIIRTPHCVLLLDEIEKAHFDIYNILLQVMDHGELTDNDGRKAYFQNVIILMTSNVGSESIHGKPIGFGEGDSSVGQGSIDKAFRPEFRNRLDAIVKFNSLSVEVIELVVDKFITEIDTLLNAKKASISISTKARRWFAENGYSKQYGARELGRLIQEKIKDPLSDAILFGPLAQGGSANIELVKNETKEDIEISYQERKGSDKSKKTVSKNKTKKEKASIRER